MVRELNSGCTDLDAIHAGMWDLLPWYVNESLAADEQVDVDAHLSTCLVCRREVALLLALRDAVSTRMLDPQCEAALGRLNARIDRNNVTQQVFPWAAAAVLVLVTGIAAMIGLNSGLLDDAASKRAYSTLGARTVETLDSQIVTARIVFDHDVTERQLRELLLEADAELIDGPTPRGAYTIAVTKAAKGDDLQAAVAQLRASKRVLFVEPIVSIGARTQTE